MRMNDSLADDADPYADRGPATVTHVTPSARCAKRVITPLSWLRRRDRMKYPPVLSRTAIPRMADTRTPESKAAGVRFGLPPRLIQSREARRYREIYQR